MHTVCTGELLSQAVRLMGGGVRAVCGPPQGRAEPIGVGLLFLLQALK